ncbi:unnamed protein product [Pieris brassicae]|uniref:Uncharacterized protein n=1 Tax=Pieris brassicae TaxID=7116 RepID=A0A9P0XE13_PIEBR|nr:unnamed protein product [Pieris brassicae]
MESENKSSAKRSIDDINSKIFDLENLIKSLQEEIDEMYVHADKEKKIQDHFEADTIDKEAASSQAYPLVLSDVDPPLAEQSNRFKSERDFLVNFGASKSMDSLSSITKAFASLWNDEENIMKRVRGNDEFKS